MSRAPGVTAAARVERVVDAVAGRLLAPAAARATGQRRLAVLTYHGVRDRDRFAAHLDWLEEHTTPIALDGAIEVLLGRQQLPPRAALITFDDGDRSLLDVGAPLLEGRRIPAAVFVVAGLLGRDEPFWWDEVAGLAGARAPALIADLKRVPNRERLAAIDDLRATSPAAAPRTRHLGRDDLLTLEAAGITIGSHSFTHPCLDRCNDDEIAREVGASRDALEAAVGRPPRAFAYPNGSRNARVEQAVRTAGYEVGFLFDHRRAAVPSSAPMAVSRLRINSYDTVDRLAAVVSGIHPALHHVRGRA